LLFFFPNLFAQRRIETSSYNPTAKSHYEQALLHRERNNFLAAKQFLFQALREDPRYVDAYDQLADLYYSAQVLDSAIYFYQQSVNILPRHLLSHQRLALVYKLQEDYSAALVQYDFILRTFADNPAIQAQTYMDMAQIYEYHLQDWQGVIQTAEEALRLYLAGGQAQKAVKARMAAAKGYYEIGTYNIATRYLKANEKYLTYDAEFNFYMGASYLKQKKLNKANEYLSKAIELGYEIPRELMQEWKDMY
jgi:tetratricopeptide (TPR) repeat protein